MDLIGGPLELAQLLRPRVEFGAVIEVHEAFRRGDPAGLPVLRVVSVETDDGKRCRGRDDRRNRRGETLRLVDADERESVRLQPPERVFALLAREPFRVAKLDQASIRCKQGHGREDAIAMLALRAEPRRPLQ